MTQYYNNQVKTKRQHKKVQASTEIVDLEVENEEETTVEKDHHILNEIKVGDEAGQETKQ